MEKLLSDLRYSLKTILCFIIACLLLPVLLSSFLVVHYSNAVVNYMLTLRYPNLIISRSKKIRSLIDTPHNAGIFNFLLHVNGAPDFEHIKRQYEELLTNARDKFGYLRYPKLRQQLITCWGHYAWVKDSSSFNLNNHILWNTHKYRGRAVCDANIEDFVSDLVRKYIPADVPQWQVIIIPTVAMDRTGASRSVSSFGDDNEQFLSSQSEEHDINREVRDNDLHYYILVKIHHLIIAEEENLHISEMLMLQDPLNTMADKRIQIRIGGIGPRKTFDKKTQQQHLQQHNLTYFVQKPEQIMRFIREMQQVIVNSWNKFKYDYESLDTPDGSQRTRLTHLSQVLSVILIIFINICQLLFSQASYSLSYFRKNKYSHIPPLISLRQLILQDASRYRLNWSVMKMAIYTSLHPCNLLKYSIRFLWSILVQGIIMLPLHLYCEFTALRELIFNGRTTLTATYSYRLAIYAPLFVYAQLEFLKILWEIFKAPVNIFEELFQFPSKETNILHMKSYSGRKIVSFSKSIDARHLRQQFASNFDSNLRESDFIMSCLAASIGDYFKTYADSAPVPKILNTTCRHIAKGFLTDIGEDKTANIGGVVFLQLPLNVYDRCQHARQIHLTIESIRSKQIMIYLASMGQTKYDLITALLPRVFTKICINYFSFIFPVTITEIHGETADFQTRWGQRVHDVLLFRPPQSKTCLSLNVHRFGSKYRLAIMADTQLGPDHSQITRSFEQYMQQSTL